MKNSKFLINNWILIIISSLLLFVNANATFFANIPILNWLFSHISSTIDPLASILFTIAVINLLVPSFFGIIWEALIEPKLDRTIKDISENMNVISKTIKQTGENIERFTHRNARYLPLLECKSTDEYRSHMDEAAVGIFGEGSRKSESLYAYTKERLLEFCQQPYRQNVTKKISLKNCSKNDFVEWTEETEYQVHHTTWPENKISGGYPIQLVVSSYAPSLDPKEWKKCASLIVTVNGDRILCSGSEPEYRKSSSAEYGFFCWKSGDWIKLRYGHLLNLDKEYTKVIIKEVSINDKRDCFYSIHTAKPVYGHSFDFELPEGMAFLGDPFVSAKIMSNGLPSHMMDKDRIKKKISISNDMSKKDRHVNLTIEDWVLPGIIADFTWFINKQG